MRRLLGLDQARAFVAGSTWKLDADLPPGVRERVRSIFGRDMNALEVAAQIIEDVRAEGDRALARHSSAIDGTPLGVFEVPREQIAAAADAIPSSLRDALHVAAERVSAFQRSAMPAPWRDGERGYGESVTSVARVGAYVPGGSAPLVSTVLMTVIPARVAGVDEVVLCTPAPGDGLPDRAVLAAAAVAGADRVFKLGGAQAIAAMALGTETVPRVDVVCGPGNIFVVAAKKLVFGEVGVDGLYGPTETLIIADDSADPDLAAADLLAQAEHDAMARPVLVATSARIADEVDAAVRRRLDGLKRADIARAAIEANGAVVIVSSVEEAVEVSNLMAPEHLCLNVEDPTRYAPLVRAAGGLFLGEYAAEVLGDYVAGPSHVMPTGGTARFASALSVRSFLRFTPVVDAGDRVFLELGRTAAELARVEGLAGHAAAAEARLQKLVGE